MTRTKHRTKPDWYKNTENELYSYDRIKKNIELIRQDMILSGSSELTEKLGGAVEATSSTERKAINLVSSIALYRMCWVIDAVNQTLEMAPECRPIFDLHYRMGYMWHRVCADTHIEKDSFYRRKNRLVEQVAELLGYKY